MKLSSPMMETLTIVAYQQPVTRADVEAIRGVQSAEMIRQLMDRSFVRIGGEDDSLGRPFLYETTRQFLSMFGLRRLEDLPNYETLRRQRTLPAIAETGEDGPFPPRLLQQLERRSLLRRMRMSSRGVREPATCRHTVLSSMIGIGSVSPPSASGSFPKL